VKGWRPKGSRRRSSFDTGFPLFPPPFDYPGGRDRGCVIVTGRGKSGIARKLSRRPSSPPFSSLRHFGPPDGRRGGAITNSARLSSLAESSPPPSFPPSLLWVQRQTSSGNCQRWAQPARVFFSPFLLSFFVCTGYQTEDLRSFTGWQVGANDDAGLRSHECGFFLSSLPRHGPMAASRDRRDRPTGGIVTDGDLRGTWVFSSPPLPSPSRWAGRGVNV